MRRARSLLAQRLRDRDRARVITVVRLVVCSITVMFACHRESSVAPDAAATTAVDAAAAAVEQVADVMPPIVVPLPFDGVCAYPDGTHGNLTSYQIIDDCVVCQCTSYGMRCARRTSCSSNVCVLVDGTVLTPGASAAVYCNECTCGASGSVTCARTTTGDCPDDGCVFAPKPQNTVPLGGQLFASECHACDCDAVNGRSCEDLCHPLCFLDAEGTMPVDDQARILGDDGCSTCLCDYGGLICENSGC